MRTPRPIDPDRFNQHVASRLDEIATLLEEQEANPFRVRAWRNAAATIRALERGVDDVLDAEGIAGLDRLPGIGPAIARVVDQLVTTGRLPMLDRLRGEIDPLRVLTTVPGIGPRLARRLHETLGIDSLEALESAAQRGALEAIPGFGAKRIAGIRDALAARLARRRRAGAPARANGEPPVSELLDVDAQYRAAARAGTLQRIAPRRFNPAREAWLPVLHTRRGARHYTALFSNTARAHELGTTHDWVVLYEDGRNGERQYTVVTATSGALRGRRVVRGREAECASLLPGARTVSRARARGAGARATARSARSRARPTRVAPGPPPSA